MNENDLYMYADQAIHWMTNDGWEISLLVLFVLVCSIVVYFAARGNRKKLVESRIGYNVESFVREMTAAGYDDNVARAVYEYIQQVHRSDLPILPSDDLYTDFGITDAAVERAMPILMDVTGRAERRKGHLRKSLMTVQDLVAAVQIVPLAKEHVREWQTA